jgi:hypothetical protein
VSVESLLGQYNQLGFLIIIRLRSAVNGARGGVYLCMGWGDRRGEREEQSPKEDKLCHTQVFFHQPSIILPFPLMRLQDNALDPTLRDGRGSGRKKKTRFLSKKG